MKLVIRKDVYEKLLKPKVYYIPLIYDDISVSKSWNPAVHPRDDHGRFSESGVMQLSEEERQGLVEYLEKEEYVDYEGVHVSKGKIDAVKKGKYSDEISACKDIAKLGFDVYLLRESYVKGSKADTFYKKDKDKDFLEIKHANGHKMITRFDDSMAQAPSTFLSITGEIPYWRYRKLKETIKKDKRNGYVIVQYKGKCKIIKKKQL